MSNVRRQPGRSPNGCIYVYAQDQCVMEAAVAALYFGFGPEKVRGTTELETVSKWIRDGDPAVLVTGVEHGPELVCAARSRFARVPLVMLTDEYEEEVAKVSETVRLLPLEFGDEELRDALDDLLPGRSTPQLADRNLSAPLLEMLQLLVRTGQRGTLRLIDPDEGKAGAIGVRGNTIVDARVEGHSVTGLGALLEMSRWKNREFRWSDDLRDAVTMNVTASDLFDEFALPSGQGGAEESEASGSSQSTLNPFMGTAGPAVGREVPDAEPVVVRTAKPGGESTDVTALNPDESRDGAQTTIGNVDPTLASLSEVSGFLAAALVDSDSGKSLGKLSGNNDFDVEAAAATNTDVVQVKMRVVRKLELDDTIQDIVITLDKQYHLIRPLEERPTLFFYLVLERGKSNLAMARMSLSDAERALKL